MTFTEEKGGLTIVAKVSNLFLQDRMGFIFMLSAIAGIWGKLLADILIRIKSPHGLFP